MSKIEESRELDLTKKLLLNQISLEELMDSLREDKQDFITQLERFTSGKYLEWISVQFLETEDVMQMYRHVINLAYLYAISLPDKYNDSLREVEDQLRKLRKQYKIDIVLEKHLLDSKEYQNKRNLIEEATETLGDLFGYLKNTILRRNEKADEIRIKHNLKKDLISQMERAGAQTYIQAESNEIGNYMQELEDPESDFTGITNHPDMKEDYNIFLANKKEGENE